MGAFTQKNNHPDSLFATSPIPGDEIILEYSQDQAESQKPLLSISQVNHDFYGFFKAISTKSVGDFGSSGDCNVDVMSDPNYALLPQVRSVCKIIIDGKELCSGTLLNNTANDSSIYFITAGHCLSLQTQASLTIFYYNYESPHGDTRIQGSRDFQTTGATLVANSDSADFALLKLAGERPLPMYRPYLSGWNRSVAPPAPYFAIHHPNGDVKKISRTSAPLIADSYMTSIFWPDFHWRVAHWNSGTTEPGSSGCGIFDNNGTLVGTLSGGDAICGASNNDYFSRFQKAWSYNTPKNQQLAGWLDPIGSSNTLNPIFGKELYGMHNATRLSNVASVDTGTVVTTGAVRYRTGVYLNSPFSKVAEKFVNINNKKIEGVYLAVGKGGTINGTSVNISFWSGTDVPQTNLYTLKNIPLSTLLSNKEKFVKLQQNLVVSGNLFVSYELNSPLSGDTLSIYFSQQKKDGASRPQNSTYLYNGTNWNAFSNEYPGSNGSLWLDIVTTDLLNSSLFSTKESSILLNIYPNPAKDKLTINSPNSAQIIESVTLISLDGGRFPISTLLEVENGVSFDIPSGLKGLYLVQVVVNHDIVNRKILIE